MTDYLTLDDLRGLHADVMRRTGFLPAPVRDVGALEAAIVRPQTVAHDEGADLLTQAVTLMLTRSQAQAFVDGNKRTAMFAALVFLELNGCPFDGNDELLAVLLEEAASRPHDEAGTTIVEWMRPQIVAQRDESAAPRPKMAAGQIMRKGDVDLVALHELVGHIFPPPGCCAVERTEEGVSTQVYRIRRDDEIFYLRVAEERDASLAPEVCVHELLRERGVKVPDIVYFEPFDAHLQRSIMVTTEIRGEHVGHRRVDGDTKEVLRAAGRDLAVINSVPVEGFGWIKRDKSAVIRLEAEHTTHRDFALEHLDEHLTLLSEKVLTEAEIVEIRTIISRYDAWLDVEHAYLAHGDFDVTHIYQQVGQYTGIIDFGEIRGADAPYDLGHFNLHDGETLPQPVLPYLLEGYSDVVPLPPDHEWRISLLSLLIGVSALARTLRRPPNDYQRHLTQSLRRAVAVLRA